MRLKCVIIILSSLAAVRNRNVLLFIADDAGLEVRNYIFVKLKVPLQVPLRVKVRSGQVQSNSDSISNSKVGPELYTKIAFHHSPTLTNISRSVSRENSG